MIVVWGSQSIRQDLGFKEATGCDFCGQEAPFHLILDYSYSHLYWIFGRVTEKKYTLVCQRCHSALPLDAGAVEQRLGGVPIPFMQRFGCLVLFLVCIAPALIALIVGLVSVATRST
jgi:hypothetical protein